MGYITCEKCGGYYELQKGESPDDFSECECGGKLKFIDNIEDYYNKEESSTEESIESTSKPKEEKKTSSKENINTQLKNNKEIITPYCPECGTKNSEITVFCKECGKQLQTNKSIPIEKSESPKKPINNDKILFDNSITMKPLNYIIIGILSILNLYLSMNLASNADFELFIPLFFILSVFVAYTLVDIEKLANGYILGFLVAQPYNIVNAFNHLGSGLLESLLVFMLLFGLIGAIGGIIGTFLKRRKIKTTSNVDNIEEQYRSFESKRKKGLIVLTIFLICLSITGIVFTSPIAWMERTGDVNGLTDVLIYGNYAEQRDAMKALGGMDEIQSNYNASGVQASPYSNKIISILIDKMKNSPDYHVRADAAELIGDIWNGDENIIVSLQDVQNSDNNKLVRMSAETAIMKINMDKDTINFQKNISMRT